MLSHPPPPPQVTHTKMIFETVPLDDRALFNIHCVHGVGFFFAVGLSSRTDRDDRVHFFISLVYIYYNQHFFCILLVRFASQEFLLSSLMVEMSRRARRRRMRGGGQAGREVEPRQARVRLARKAPHKRMAMMMMPTPRSTMVRRRETALRQSATLIQTCGVALMT
jgi:hypothetical protein